MSVRVTECYDTFTLTATHVGVGIGAMHTLLHSTIVSIKICMERSVSISMHGKDHTRRFLYLQCECIESESVSVSVSVNDQ